MAPKQKPEHTTINKDGTVSIDLSIKAENVSTLEEFEQLYNKAHLEFKAKTTLTALIKKQLKDAFKKHPNVLSVSWHQFTPYFMDGEPCTFSGPYCIRLEIDGEPELVQSDDLSQEQAEKHESTIEDFDWICGVESDFLLAMFGDHVEVTVERNLKISIDEYTRHD